MALHHLIQLDEGTFAKLRGLPHGHDGASAAWLFLRWLQCFFLHCLFLHCPFFCWLQCLYKSPSLHLLHSVVVAVRTRSLRNSRSMDFGNPDVGRRISRDEFLGFFTEMKQRMGPTMLRLTIDTLISIPEIERGYRVLTRTHPRYNGQKLTENSHK